jgi:hypothetical protein
MTTEQPFGVDFGEREFMPNRIETLLNLTLWAENEEGRVFASSQTGNLDAPILQ